MAFITVNWPAIVLAAVAAWLFGALYYTTLGSAWVAAQGKTTEQVKAENAGIGRVAFFAPFAVAFVAAVLMGWVLYGILLHLGTFSVRAGLITGAFCWLGFVVTTTAVNNAFAMRRSMLTVIDVGHWLGALLIIGAIVGWMGR